MNGYADTGFLGSLYLVERTSADARACIANLNEPLPLIPLALLELRNTFNLAIVRGRISEVERDGFWSRFQTHLATGTYRETPIPGEALHARARELSDRYTPTIATRSLDLLHVAAAALLGAKTFYSFDERQRKAAAGEGLKVKP